MPKKLIQARKKKKQATTRNKQKNHKWKKFTIKGKYKVVGGNNHTQI